VWDVGDVRELGLASVLQAARKPRRCKVWGEKQFVDLVPRRVRGGVGRLRVGRSTWRRRGHGRVFKNGATICLNDPEKLKPG
jgi:hypothetical protein